MFNEYIFNWHDAYDIWNLKQQCGQIFNWSKKLFTM